MSVEVSPKRLELIHELIPTAGAFTVVVPAPPAARSIALIDVAAPDPEDTGSRDAAPPGDGGDGRRLDGFRVTDITSFAIEGRGDTK